MKKNKGLAYAVLGVAFLVFNVIVFAIPTEKTAVFWISYVFSIVAFALQVLIWRFAFNSEAPLKSKFLGIPLIHIGLVYLIIQLIAFAIFIALPNTPGWVAVVISALILGLSVICLIGAETGRDEIVRVEENVHEKIFPTKLMQIDVEMLAEQETDLGTREALQKLAEKIRFSDPMSNDLLVDIETQISNKVAQLKITNNKIAIITDIELLLTERNKKAKLLK